MSTFDINWPTNKVIRSQKESGLAFTHLMHTQNAICIKNLTKCMNVRSGPHNAIKLISLKINEGVDSFYE